MRTRKLVQLSLVLAMLFALVPQSALAQLKDVPPMDGDATDPTVSISPSSGPQSGTTVNVTIQWCDNQSLDVGSRLIEVNGIDRTSSFTYSTGYKVGCGAYGVSTGNVSLEAAGTVVEGTIRDTAYNQGYSAVSYQIALEPPVVDLTPHSDGLIDPSMCVAGCAESLLSYTTPSYVSLDQPRSVTVVFRATQARPYSTVRVRATDNSLIPAGRFSIRLKRRWTGAYQTLHNGSTEVFFRSDSTLNTTAALTAGFDASDLETGAYDYQLTVRSWWGSTFAESTPINVRVLIQNEASSPYGVGWTVAGAERIHTIVLGGVSDGLVLTDGTGRIAFFEEGACTSYECHYDGPDGDFSQITYFTPGGSPWYERVTPDGITYTYNSQGYLTDVEDRFGNSTHYLYDVYDRLTYIFDPVGKYYHFGYSGSRIAYIGDSSGRTTQFTLLWGRVTRILDPNNEYALDNIRYYGSGHLRSLPYDYRDREGNEWDIRYDFARRIDYIDAPQIRKWDGTLARPRSNYQSRELELLQSTSVGSSSNPVPFRAPYQDRIRVADPEGGWTRYEQLNAFGQAGAVYDPRNRRELRSYTTEGQLDWLQRPNLTAVDYTWAGPVLQRVQDSSASVDIHYGYGAYHQLASVSGSVTTRSWDLNSDGLPERLFIGGAQTPSVVYTYDTRGRLKSATDADDYTTRYDYASNGFQNLEVVTDTSGQTEVTHDNYGRIASRTNALSETDSISYDLLNRPVRRVGPLNDVTTIDYDGPYRVQVTDAEGGSHSFYANALGWDTMTVEEGRLPEEFGYDRAGRLKRYTNRRGQVTSFGYNTAGELTSRTSGGTQATYSTSIDLQTMTGRVTLGDGTVIADTIYYDQAGRMEEQITYRAGNRYRISSNYNGDSGRLATIDLFGGGSLINQVGYSYSEHGGLDTLNASGGVGDTRFGYNPRLLAEWVTWDVPNVTATIQRPSSGKPGDVQFSRTALQRRFGAGYQQDALARTVRRTEGDDTAFTEYEYDSLGQLESAERWVGDTQMSCTLDPVLGKVCNELPTMTLEQSWSYSWDAVGNPSGETVNPVNRLATLGGISIQYDEDGNITRRTGGGQTIDFWWNPLGQLDSAKSSLGPEVRFDYDAFGRRVRVRGSGSGGDRWVVLSGQSVVADVSLNGSAQRVYNYTPGGGLHSFRELQGGQAYYYVRDLNGTVLGLFGTAGGWANHYSYSPFGSPLTTTEMRPNRFRFGGGEKDDLGLYYFRARYYDPEIRRFLSQDPIGLASGMNLYRYANNDPINFSDPTGLDPCRDRWGAWALSFDGHCVVPIDGVTAAQTVKPRYFRIPDMFAAGFPDLGAALSQSPSGLSDPECRTAIALTAASAVGDLLTFTGTTLALRFGVNAIFSRNAARLLVSVGEPWANFAGRQAAEAGLNRVLAQSVASATVVGSVGGDAHLNMAAASSGWRVSWQDFVPILATKRLGEQAAQICGGQ